MSELKVEWAVGLHLERRQTSIVQVPVVRLEALQDVIYELADECFQLGNTQGRLALERLERILEEASA